MASVPPAAPSARTSGVTRRTRLNAELVIGGAIVACVALSAAVGPFFVRNGALQTNLLNRLEAPGTPGHILGTDELGRDVASRLIDAASVTMSITLPAVTIAVLLGVTLGLLTGYRGGLTDLIAMRVVDAQLAYPMILLAIVAVAVFGSSWLVLVIVFTLATWAPFARLVRAEVMQARNAEYVLSAKVTGASSIRIMIRHLLPNVSESIVTLANISMAQVILLESGLSYLGLGVQPPNPTWGNMVLGGQPYIANAWWLITLPGLCIIVTVLGFHWLAEGLKRRSSRGISTKPASTKRRGGANKSAQKQVRAEARPQQTDSAPTEGRKRDDLVLSIRDLSVAYHTAEGPQVAVEDFSLDVTAREMVGIVGESGSGKSSLARAMLRLIPNGVAKVSGSVEIDGHDVFAATGDELRAIRGGAAGMVLQDPMSSLNPSLSIGVQLIEAIRAHGKVTRSEARQQALHLLDLVALPDPAAHMKQYPVQLSGGMCQRVAIAVGIAAEPALLIADEPTSALDVTVQRQIMDLLRTLGRRLGLSVVFITHDLELAAEFCDRVVVMYAGRVVEAGESDDVFREPLMPYTTGLIRCVPSMDDDHRAGELPSIRGSIYDSRSLTRGCRFAPRCNFARLECGLKEPALTPHPDRAEHVVRCLGALEGGWISSGTPV